MMSVALCLRVYVHMQCNTYLYASLADNRSGKGLAIRAFFAETQVMAKRSCICSCLFVLLVTLIIKWAAFDIDCLPTHRIMPVNHTLDIRKDRCNIIGYSLVQHRPTAAKGGS